MSVTLDIFRTYRAPGEVQARRACGPPSEARALVTLVAACLLGFVASAPAASRLAAENPDLPLDGLLGAELFVWMFLVPLLFYAIALVARVIAGLMGGKGTGYSARMVLFWAFLAAAPLKLFAGLLEGFAGPGTAASVASGIWGVAFVLFWVAGLRVTEGRERAVA